MAKKIKRIAIYDLDGTVIDSSHRYRTIDDGAGKRIDLEHWRENQHKADLDSLLPLHKQYTADLQDETCFTIVVTAREMHDVDDVFMRDILGAPDYLISRPHGSSISGKTLKINGLAKFFCLKQFRGADVVFYEDNIEYLKAVCDRFNIRGIYIPSVQGY